MQYPIALPVILDSFVTPENALLGWTTPLMSKGFILVDNLKGASGLAALAILSDCKKLWPPSQSSAPNVTLTPFLF
jgi:hypothetical protein